MRVGAIAFLLIILAGCASSPPPPPPPLSTSDAFDLSNASNVVTRQYLTRDEKMSDVKASMKSLVLLRKGSEKRNKQVCKAFLQLPTTDVVTGAGVAADKITPTIWLVTEKPAVDATCDDILKVYDYETAAVFFQHLQRPSAKGPLIAALLGQDQKVAFVDLEGSSGSTIAALVPAWSKALLANDGADISLDDSFLSKSCKAAGVDQKTVKTEVLKIVDQDSNGFWNMVKSGVSVVAAYLPYGQQVTQLVKKTCDKVIMPGPVTA